MGALIGEQAPQMSRLVQPYSSLPLPWLDECMIEIAEAISHAHTHYSHHRKNRYRGNEIYDEYGVSHIIEKSPLIPEATITHHLFHACAKRGMFCYPEVINPSGVMGFVDLLIRHDPRDDSRGGERIG